MKFVSKINFPHRKSVANLTKIEEYDNNSR